MNRWAHKPTIKILALVAAALLAIAPVDLLAACGCTVCGCAAAAETAAGCCCTGQSHAGGCCDSAVSCANDRPGNAAKPEGCSCSQSVPAPPIGTLPVTGNAHDQPLPAAGFAALPSEAPAAGSFPGGYLQDQPLWPVPARILLCVWRN